MAGYLKEPVVLQWDMKTGSYGKIVQHIIEKKVCELDPIKIRYINPKDVDDFSTIDRIKKQILVQCSQIEMDFFEITEEQITKFQDTEQYMEPTKNRMKLLNQTAYLSKKILEESWKVGYMYRAEPVNENDSGWSFLAGNEDDEYYNDYKNIALVSVQEVYQLDPDIWNYIDNPVGTELIRISSNEFEIDKRDKEIYMEKRKD